MDVYASRGDLAEDIDTVQVPVKLVGDDYT